MPKIILELEKCVHSGKDRIDCPYAGSAHTPASGFGTDYFCKLVPDEKEEHGFKITSGYVEWDREINPIPIWCPIMAKEDKMLKILET